jgi:hypothetical protein
MYKVCLSQSGPAINLCVTFLVAKPTCDGVVACCWFVLLLGLAFICLPDIALISDIVTGILVLAAMSQVITLVIVAVLVVSLIFYCLDAIVSDNL